MAVGVRRTVDKAARMQGLTGRVGLAALATAVGLCVLAAGGCASDETPPISSDAARSDTVSTEPPVLRPVPEPDLSQISDSDSLREEIGLQYAALMRAADNPETVPLELGQAFGGMGMLLMAAQYTDEAEACFLNAQALAPGERRWPYYLGHLNRATGEPGQAAVFFEQARQLRPNDVSTLVWLSEMYLEDGRPEVARPLIEHAVALEPKSLAARSTLGRVAIARRDYFHAVQYLEDALTLDPQAAGIHSALATAYRSLGDLDRAGASLRRGTVGGAAAFDFGVIRPADPLMEEVESLVQTPAAFEIRGTGALDRGDHRQAVAHFRSGLKLAPDSLSLRHKLGTALAITGDVGGSQEQFEAIVRRSPDYADAHYSLGVLMEGTGRYPQAIARYTAAVRYDPDSTEPRLRLAGLLRRSGRPDDALSQYERVTQINPRVIEAPFGYAMVLVGLGRYREARDRLADGMTAFPEARAFSVALARVLAAAPDDRVRDGRRAMAIMQDLPDEARLGDFGETVAMALAEVGQSEEAAAQQRLAIAAANETGLDELAQRMAENLRLYEAGQPSRTPWRDGELP